MRRKQELRGPIAPRGDLRYCRWRRLNYSKRTSVKLLWQQSQIHVSNVRVFVNTPMHKMCKGGERELSPDSLYSLVLIIFFLFKKLFCFFLTIFPGRSRLFSAPKKQNKKQQLWSTQVPNNRQNWQPVVEHLAAKETDIFLRSQSKTELKEEWISN